MLTEREIIVGVVAYLDPAILDADPMVLAPASPTDGRRPFVCVGRSGSLSAWMALTTKPGPGRSHFPIPISVRRRGRGVWCTGPSFVNKQFATYIAPSANIIAAAAQEDEYGPEERPGIEPGWLQREIVPRCRERRSLEFGRWHRGCGAKKESAPVVSGPRLGVALLSDELVAKLRPPVVTPAPAVQAAKVTPDETNWAAFIEPERVTKEGGKQ